MENKRNLWVIPTDKPSRLWLTKLGNLTRCHDIKPIKKALGNNVNIYITNDEEIKVGDWMIRANEQPIKVTKYFFWDFGGRYYKIILTTDQDLIKDGVQAIDDEFLEWFVKNPNCEEIGVKKYENNKYWTYEKIIPKEEPKQRLEKYSERFDNKDNEIVDGIFNPDTWGKRMVEEPNYNMKQEIIAEMEKQETLEEALNKFVRTMLLDQSVYIDFLQCAEFGAKWQQERSYSEEDLKHAFFSGWQLRDGDLPFPKAKNKWFNEFKK